HVLVALTGIEHRVHFFGRQVLVKVETDLHHRRSAARAEAFDFGERELAVRRRLARLDAEALRALFSHTPRAHDLARERAADLYVVLADRLHVDHRIERGRLPHVGDAHAQAICDIGHARLVEPAALALHDEHE